MADSKLPLRTKFAFGIGQVAEGVKNTGFATFLLIYYNQVLGLSGSLAGLAIILERVDRKEASLRTWEKVKALFPGMERAQEAIERLQPEVDGKKT